jgi:hypothetical protein
MRQMLRGPRLDLLTVREEVLCEESRIDDLSL